MAEGRAVDGFNVGFIVGVAASVYAKNASSSGIKSDAIAYVHQFLSMKTDGIFLGSKFSFSQFSTPKIRPLKTHKEQAFYGNKQAANRMYLTEISQLQVR